MYGIRTLTQDQDMMAMHEEIESFPYKLIPEAMKKIKDIMKGPLQARSSFGYNS